MHRTENETARGGASRAVFDDFDYLRRPSFAISV